MVEEELLIRLPWPCSAVPFNPSFEFNMFYVWTWCRAWQPIRGICFREMASVDGGYARSRVTFA